MFFLWVKIIKIKNIKSNFESFTCEDTSEVSTDIINSLNELITRTVNEANIDDSDEYLNIKAVTNQTKMNRINNCVDRAPNIPKYVATPFPPLNFSHKGKICPKNTISAERFVNSGKYLIVIITGIYPLRTSRHNVEKAKILFPVLRTFVVPILPEPIFLMSLLWNIFVNIRPKGIEPLIYETKKTKIISILY